MNINYSFVESLTLNLCDQRFKYFSIKNINDHKNI